MEKLLFDGSLKELYGIITIEITIECDVPHHVPTMIWVFDGSLMVK